MNSRVEVHLVRPGHRSSERKNRMPKSSQQPKTGTALGARLHEYEKLEANLADLPGRLKRKAY